MDLSRYSECKKIFSDYIKCEHRRIFFNNKIYCKYIYDDFARNCINIENKIKLYN